MSGTVDFILVPYDISVVNAEIEEAICVGVVTGQGLNIYQ